MLMCVSPGTEWLGELRGCRAASRHRDGVSVAFAERRPAVSAVRRSVGLSGQVGSASEDGCLLLATAFRSAGRAVGPSLRMSAGAKAWWRTRNAEERNTFTSGVSVEYFARSSQRRMNTPLPGQAFRCILAISGRCRRCARPGWRCGRPCVPCFLRTCPAGRRPAGLSKPASR
jgi:hypothetical protein